jgi:hypothetical protein
LPRKGLLRGGFFSPFQCVKKETGEQVCQCYLADTSLHELLEKVDSDLAEEVRRQGCVYCGTKLHRADYPRKPRGGSDAWEWRDSFCCAQEGCRKRHTPPSVRFLGRRVYVSLMVVLVSALRHGLTPTRIGILRESLGIDRRTVERWRQRWLESFVQSSFWKEARARFMPMVCEKSLPWSLCEVFDIERRDRLLALLKFLSPISTKLAFQARSF